MRDVIESVWAFESGEENTSKGIYTKRRMKVFHIKTRTKGNQRIISVKGADRGKKKSERRLL